jgi:hypothetical protein
VERLVESGGKEAMNWITHLDVMLFIVVFLPIAVEYILWRINKSVIIKIQEEKDESSI